MMFGIGLEQQMTTPRFTGCIYSVGNKVLTHKMYANFKSAAVNNLLPFDIVVDMVTQKSPTSHQSL